MKRNSMLWFLGLLVVVLMASMSYYLRDLKPTLIAAQLTFSREAFEGVLSRWSPEQLQRFSRHFTVDYVFLFIYGAFGWLLGRRLTDSHSTPSKCLRLLPCLLPIAAVFDCAENALHQAFVSQASAVPESLYFVAGLAALVKWTAAIAFTVIAVQAWRKNAA